MNVPAGYLLPPTLAEMTEACLTDHELFGRIKPRILADIVQWINENIDLSRDRSSRSNGFADLNKTPYGIDVARSWEKRTCRELLVSAPPQTGKTVLSWGWPALWSMDCDPGPLLTVYQNLPVAVKTNRLRIEPLMEGIPKLADQLNSPHCKTTDQYDFKDMYWNFQGAGAPITSIPFRRAIADEYLYWKMPNDISKSGGVSEDGGAGDEMKFVNNIIALRDRVNTFEEISLIVYCCTPQLSGGADEDLIAEMSGGVWHMACLECGHLIPSHQIDSIRVGREVFGGLQEDAEIVQQIKQLEDDSRRNRDQSLINQAKELRKQAIRYVCTNAKCQHEHLECDREAMNAPANGAKYIHERPELVDIRPSFQWSKLAAPFTSWEEILKQRKRAANSNSLAVRQHYENTVRGLPFQIGKLGDEYLKKLAKHCQPLPDPELIDEIYFSADTQDEGRYYVQGAFDKNENLYILEARFCPDDDGMDEAWEFEYEEIGLTAGLVDQGGHGNRPRDTKRWCVKKQGCMTYVGDPRAKKKDDDRNWDLRDVTVDRRKYKNKRIRADAKHYQAELIYRLHLANEAAKNCQIYFPEGISDEFLEHMAALRPDSKSRYGLQPQNWTNNGRADHWFDCVKQLLVMRDARNWAKGKRTKGKRINAVNA